MKLDLYTKLKLSCFLLLSSPRRSQKMVETAVFDSDHRTSFYKTEVRGKQGGHDHITRELVVLTKGNARYRK